MKIERLTAGDDVRVLEVARSAGCYGMWALTDRDNRAAIATYRSADASPEGEHVMLGWTFELGCDDIDAVIVVVAWFANHRHGDRDGVLIDDGLARQTVVELATRSFGPFDGEPASR